MLGCFAAAFFGATGVTGLVSVAGWLQRATLAIAFAWIVMLALSCLAERERATIEAPLSHMP